MYKKQTLYQQEGKRLVSIYPRDLPALDGLLTAKLRLFGYTLPEASARRAKPEDTTSSPSGEVP